MVAQFHYDLSTASAHDSIEPAKYSVPQLRLMIREVEEILGHSITLEASE